MQVHEKLIEALEKHPHEKVGEHHRRFRINAHHLHVALLQSGYYSAGRDRSVPDVDSAFRFVALHSRAHMVCVHQSTDENGAFTDIIFKHHAW